MDAFLQALFNKLMEEDKKFYELVSTGYEVVPHLAMTTDLSLTVCSSLEKMADIWYENN